MQIDFASTMPADWEVVALTVEKDGLCTVEWGGLQEAKMIVEAAATAQRFKGEAGSVAETFASVDGSVRRVLLLGVGKGSENDWEKAGGALTARLLTSGAATVVVDIGALGDRLAVTAVARFAGAAAQRAWRHDVYRTKLPDNAKPTLASIVIIGAPAGIDGAWSAQNAITKGLELTRTLVAEPANIIYPESFVEHVRADVEGLGLEIEVLDEAAMREHRMGALLGVSQGSVREARILALRWNGAGDGDPALALVGKGVTFDTGGISLKPGAGMEDMKWDMGGAGAVVGAMKAIAARGANANVVGVCGLVENMPDGNAQRPGDVVTSMSGQTIEVINTDAEGRLVLADVLTWTQKTYRPKTIVDLATLTGAILVSLGHEHGGLFSNDDGLAQELIDAGEASGDLLWRMPLSEKYDKLIDSPIADMKNVGPRPAGSITAAQFIKRFVDDGVRWAHLDVAGMVWADKPGTNFDKGATGYGVRLLDRFVANTLER